MDEEFGATEDGDEDMDDEDSEDDRDVEDDEKISMAGEESWLVSSEVYSNLCTI